MNLINLIGGHDQLFTFLLYVFRSTRPVMIPKAIAKKVEATLKQRS